MITKEDFINYINSIIKERQKWEIFNDAINSISSTYPMIMIERETEDSLIDVLNKSFNLSNFQGLGTTIDWWLEDDDKSGKWIEVMDENNVTYKYLVDTIEKLYDYVSIESDDTKWKEFMIENGKEKEE